MTFTSTADFQAILVYDVVAGDDFRMPIKGHITSTFARGRRTVVLSDLGRPQTRASIHRILTNEKYIANNIFNRVSYKSK